MILSVPAEEIRFIAARPDADEKRRRWVRVSAAGASASWSQSALIQQRLDARIAAPERAIGFGRVA